MLPLPPPLTHHYATLAMLDSLYHIPSSSLCSLKIKKKKKKLCSFLRPTDIGFKIIDSIIFHLAPIDCLFLASAI